MGVSVICSTSRATSSPSVFSCAESYHGCSRREETCSSRGAGSIPGEPRPGLNGRRPVIILGPDRGRSKPKGQSAPQLPRLAPTPRELTRLTSAQWRCGKPGSSGEGSGTPGGWGDWGLREILRITTPHRRRQKSLHKASTFIKKFQYIEN